MRSVLKTLAGGALFAVVLLGGVNVAYASSLTDAQIQAIVGLLQSFNIDQTIIVNVEAVLNGKKVSSSTSVIATSTPVAVNNATNASTATSTAVSTSDATSTTTTSLMILTPTGICIVRDNDTNLPKFFSPNSSKGYEKIPKIGVNTISGLQSSCTQDDYDSLIIKYCQNNNEIVQEQVATYGADETYQTVTCGAFGCDMHRCPIRYFGAATSSSVGGNTTQTDTTSSSTTSPGTSSGQSSSSATSSSSSSQSGSPTPTPTPTPTRTGSDGTWCYDSDSSPYTKGYCQDTSGTHTDYCENSTTVRDWYCGGTWGGSWTNVNCEAGGYSLGSSCVDGALTVDNHQNTRSSLAAVLVALDNAVSLLRFFIISIIK